VKADNLTLELTGTFTNIGPLVVSNALTINAAQGINNSNASIHTGTLNINSHDGWLNNTNGQINAQSFNANIAGQLDNTRGKISVVGDANLKTGDVVATNGSFKSTSGNFTLDSTGNIALKASTFSAQQGTARMQADGSIDLGYIQGPPTAITQTQTDTLQSGQMLAGGCAEQGQGDSAQTICTSDQWLVPQIDKTTTTSTTQDGFNGTLVQGQQIQIEAGQNLNITASELQSVGNIDLRADGNVTIAAAVGQVQTTHTQTTNTTSTVQVVDGTGDNASYSTATQTTGQTVTETTNGQFVQGSSITSAQGTVRVKSGSDMAIDSSTLQGEQGVALLSAGNLNIGGQHLKGQSTESKPATAGQQATTTAKETQTFAGSTISSGSGSVSAVALGDVSVSGSTLAAEQNINLIGDSVSVKAQVNTTESLETQGNPNGGRHWQTTDEQTQTLAGGKVEAGQDINVIAGMSAELGYQVGLLASPTSALPERSASANSGNITLSGAQLSAGTPGSQKAGQVNLLAQGDIDIGTVEEVNTNDTFKFDKHSNTGGNSTITQHTVTETHTQVGTSVSADQINVVAGGDLNMTGSAVSAAGDVNLAATGNVTIQAATNTETRYTEDSRRSSGITSSGGLSLHIGSSSQKSQAWLDATSQSQGMSLVGSEFGSVNVSAGKDNNISGSIVGTTSAGEIAAAKVANGTATKEEAKEAKEWLERLQDANAKDPQLATNPRDINLSGQSVSVTSGLDTMEQDTKFESKKSGVTVALSNAVVSAVQEAASTGETLSHAASNTSSSRMQGLAGAAGALAAYNTYNKVSDILKDPKQVTGFSIDISLGSSKSSGSTHDESTTAVGSQVISAGSVNVTARNPKPNPDGTPAPATANAGNILIEGSQVIATKDINLNADRDIKLLAAGNTSEHSSQNQSSSASVGVGFALGGAANGFTINASASRAKGQANGESQSSTNTSLQAGGTLTFNSGGDTTFQGATASAEQVTGRVGGDLILTSLQDTSTYAEKQSSTGVGVSLCIPPICAGASTANVSVSKTNINSNYQSVGEQTAIRAGDGGFNIDVQGKTTLTGAQITSTDKAVQGGKNSFTSAGGIDMQDLQNSAQYDASSYSLSARVQGDSRKKDGTPMLDKAGQPIKGKPEGSAGFGSDSGQGSSTSTSGISGVAGNTSARTGDQETGLKPLFDAAKTKADVQGQVAITAEFGKNASKAWGDFATNQENELRSQGKHEEADKWREGGTYRAAGHFAIGGLGGGGAGALASGGISLAADSLNSLQDELKDKLIELGMSPDAAQMFSQGAGMATAGTLGTAAGGTVGGGSAFNTDTSNRQLHPEEKQRIKELAKGDPQKEARLTAAACALVKCYAEYPEGSAAYNALKIMADAGSSDAMAAERQELQAQKGLFEYSTQGVFSDKNIDATKQFNNTYQITTRSLGAGQALLGGAGVAGSLATAPVSCATGIGCVANAAVATISADAAITGFKQAVSGQPENTYLNQALQGLGLSPEAAGYAEFALGVGGAAKVGSMSTAGTAKHTTDNAAARISYEDISKFGAKGLNVTPEVMQTPQARALISEYQAAGVPAELAFDYSIGVLKTGNALPVARTVSANEELIKVVPRNSAGNDGVGASSPYFMTRSEYDEMSKLNPVEIGQRLGLPAQQSVRGAQLGFEAYSITPKPGTTPKVFTSTVAPVEQGTYTAAGGAQQTIVPNRSLWTEPKPLGKVGGAK
ncbi:hemagglutinin repeat-containing protein, partial [Limnohabitans sp.]|uniref:hemagglutinin repeat-containing protein n=2 Tax=Limnohabitans sp. TaxID=1907725 RepID=UPI0025BFE1AA